MVNIAHITDHIPQASWWNVQMILQTEPHPAVFCRIVTSIHSVDPDRLSQAACQNDQCDPTDDQPTSCGEDARGNNPQHSSTTDPSKIPQGSEHRKQLGLSRDRCQIQK